MNRPPIQVLIVDDSAVVRQTLRALLEEEPGIEVIGAVGNPYEAVRKMKEVRPDVITLDLEMPRMDGLTFLRKLMAQHPIPVVVCSSLAKDGADAALEALALGAVEVIAKPELGTQEFLRQSRERVVHAIRAASRARVQRRGRAGLLERKQTVDEVAPVTHRPKHLRTTDKVLVVGASTGGTEALRIFLQALPEDCPGVFVVQHMPEQFTRAFAERLNGICRVDVSEATDGSQALRGHVLIAPGGRHLLLRRSGARYFAQIDDGPLVNRHRPSVDRLFRSAAQDAGPNALGVLMTGMGDDGARGCEDLRATGAVTLVQDEATCVVFGMPAAAIRRGAASEVLPLDQLAPRALQLTRARTTPAPFLPA